MKSRLLQIVEAVHPGRAEETLREDRSAPRAVNARVGAFAAEIEEYSFGASEDATLLARAVAARGGLAGIFVLGADLADGHHTPHFDFDEAVLSQGVLLLASLAAGTLPASE